MDGLLQYKQPNTDSTCNTDGGKYSKGLDRGDDDDGEGGDGGTEVSPGKGVEGRDDEVPGQAAKGARDIVEKATPDKVCGAEVRVAYSKVLG